MQSQTGACLLQVNVSTRTSVFLCVLSRIEWLVSCWPLLPVVLKCVCICAPVCCVSAVEFGQCSVACALVSIACLWAISATVDSASIDWCGLNTAAHRRVFMFSVPVN